MKIKSVTGTNVQLELTSKSTSTPPQKIKSSGSNGQWESYSERAAIQKAQEQQKLNKQHKAQNKRAQAEFVKAQKSETKKESQSRQPKSKKQNSPTGEDPNANRFLFPNLGVGVPEIVLDFETKQKK